MWREVGGLTATQLGVAKLIVSARTGGDKSVAAGSHLFDESADRSRHRDGDDHPTALDCLQYALEFRSWGWATFAVNRNKKPVVSWKRCQEPGGKFTDRELCRQFGRGGVSGLAVVTGRASGGRGWVLGCRDFDTMESYRAWAADRPGLAATLPTVTTSRGAHVYARLRSDDLFVKFPDGELRADSKHFVVLPPSRHPSGVLYRWVPDRPTGLKDFPVLDPADTGFLRGRPGPVRRRSTSTAESTREAQDTLCPADGTSAGLDDLPVPLQEAVLRSLPNRPGERNDRLLYLARTLADIGRGVPAEHWLPVVRAWWRLALPVVRTKDWGTSWARFRAAWSDCQVPVSASRPLKVMADAAAAATDPEAKLRAACRAMAANAPNGTFHLSCRVAAKLCGLEKTQANGLLSGLVAEGFLAVVEPGSRGVLARRATSYRLGAGAQ